MEKEINGCMNCPMLNRQSATCQNPYSEDIGVEFKEDKKTGFFIYYTPDNCPLLKESITIILKK
jgi:hypothetical protein